MGVFDTNQSIKQVNEYCDLGELHSKLDFWISQAKTYQNKYSELEHYRCHPISTTIKNIIDMFRR